MVLLGTGVDRRVPFDELIVGDLELGLDRIALILGANLMELDAVLRQLRLSGLVVTGRGGCGGSLSSLGRAGGRHSGRGLSSRGSGSGLGRLVIICLTRDTILSFIIEFGAIQIRVERLEVVKGDALAVGKGFTGVARTGSSTETAVDTATGESISNRACSKQLR